MKKSPQVHSPAFKAQVALAAIKGDQTLSMVAAQFGVHVKIVQAWKKQMLEEAATVFTEPTQAGELKQEEAQQAELYEQIGRLKKELEWVKKKQPHVTTHLKPGDVSLVFVQAAERGLKSSLQSGELGFPVLNVQASLVDAIFDPVKSTEIAFEVAGDDAVRKAFRDNILLLEPVGKLTVGVPEEFLGSVISFVITRRGEVLKQDSNGRYAILEARVPLVKMFDYADEIRSLTQGRAAPSLEPDAFAAAPEKVLRGFLNPEY